MRSGLVTIMAMAFAGAALAEDYADLRGRWTGETESVWTLTSRFYNRRDDAVVFSGAPATLEIEHQEGRRFAGSIRINQWAKPVVGVFTDESTLQWAEPGGLVEARLLDADTLDFCYFRPGEFQQVASCATLKRESGS